MRQQVLYLSLVVASVALGCGSGAGDGGTGGTSSGGASGGGSTDDIDTSGGRPAVGGTGAASGGGVQAGGSPAGGNAGSGGDAASGGDGGGGDELDMERVLQARKLKRRISLGDSDIDACIVVESGGIYCSDGLIRDESFDLPVDLVTFGGLGYCVILDDQSVKCDLATSDSQASKDFAASVTSAEDLEKPGNSLIVIKVGGGRINLGNDEDITFEAPSGSMFGGLDAESCVLEPSGQVSCVWAIPGIEEAVDKTEFDLPNKKYVSISQALGIFSAIDDTGSLKVRSKYEEGLKSYPGQKFVQVAATTDFWCAIKNDGTLMCDAFDPGEAPGGYLDIPSGEFVAVDVNERFACAIRVTGEVACWGEIAPTFEDKVRMD
jgi:hypothetical protein